VLMNGPGRKMTSKATVRESEKVRSTTMPDQIERKRLKKKMLDRWENEGGRVAADPVIANQSNSADQREGDASQASVSNNSSRVKSTPSRKKRQK